MTTEERHAHWRTIIKDQTASGKDIATYCRELQIHTSLILYLAPETQGTAAMRQGLR